MSIQDHGIIALVVSIALTVAGTLLHIDLKGQVCSAPAAAAAPASQ